MNCEVNLLVTKFRLGGIFGMSLEEHCYELKVTLNLEMLVTFGINFKEVCSELDTQFHNNSD
jgi:hypothetical protein